jgi:hypothetical protein
MFVFQLTFHSLLEFDCDFLVGLLCKLFPHIKICSLHGQCDFEFAVFTSFLYFTFQITIPNLTDTIPFRAWCCCCRCCYLSICFRGGGSDGFHERSLEIGEVFSEFIRVCGLFGELSYTVLDFVPNFLKDVQRDFTVVTLGSCFFLLSTSDGYKRYSFQSVSVKHKRVLISFSETTRRFVSHCLYSFICFRTDPMSLGGR